MAITLSRTVWNGKYKITNLEDADYIVVCILGSQDNSTKRDPPIYVYKLYRVNVFITKGLIHLLPMSCY
jgi:hypothetical protein